jgi:uncharacterized protein YkwD
MKKRLPGTGERWRYTAWLAALGAVVSGVFAMTADPEPVVIVDARVVWTEPALEDGGLVYGLEVEEVVHGYAPGSVLVAREPEDRRQHLGTFLAQKIGDVIRVELRALDDGFFEVVRALDIETLTIEDETVVRAPAAIAINPAPVEDPLASPDSVPRRIRLAAEDLSTEQDVVEIVNVERWLNGKLPPLKRNTALDNSSETHSTNMAVRDFFAHCDLDTLTQPGDRMLAAGYCPCDAAGENIAAGSSSASLVMTLWMGSPDHRANILSTSYREIGVGYYQQAGDGDSDRLDENGNCAQDGLDGPFGHYWTQNFGRRNSVFPVVVDREASSATSQIVSLYVYGQGSVQMRFRNENGSFPASWESFSSSKVWLLSSGTGDKTVSVQLDLDGDNDPEFENSDAVYWNGSCTGTLLEDQELGNSPPYVDCHIAAGNGVTVSGETEFLADMVTLFSGFSVDAGVEFRVGPRP